LKHEQLNYERFRTKEAAKLSVIDYVVPERKSRFSKILHQNL
jgi:hypothetical protein